MSSSEQSHTLPVLKGPVDMMRNGAVAFKQTVLTAHPVETIQKTHFKNEWDTNLHITERVYGSGVAFEKNLDKSVLQTIQRAPGLPSSHILVDTFLGRADKIGIEDVLNLPEHRPNLPKKTPHEVTETRLGIY